MHRSRLPVLLAAVAALGLAPGLAVAATEGVYQGLLPVVKFDVSPPLGSLKPIQPVAPPLVLREMKDDPLEPLGEFGPQDFDPLVQGWTGPGGEIPGPLQSFNGPNNLAGVQPPDPVGDVGPDHYVAMSNLFFAVYSKTGTLLYGPAANNTLWSGFGGPCQTENAGDPIVLYDQLADRWLMTQFTDSSGPPFYNCIALSTTGDPTGAWYRWQVDNGSRFPDYPKYGVWPDAYYLSTRDFSGSQVGVGAFALNRAQMLVGTPALQVVAFFVPNGATRYNIGDGLLPTDLDGTVQPPAGTPNFFLGSMDNGATYGAPQDALTIWEFHVDFVTPANSTFTLANTLPIAPFDTIYGTCASNRQCIPQPGTTNRIDILSYRQRPLHRAAYRNFGSHQVIVTNQSVEAQASPQIAGIRWWEIRDPDGSPTIHQEGTYAPGISDGIHRWMGSAAMDSSGNLALGYSASAATGTFPSSWYTGRLATDPPGTLPQGEASIIDGLGSQTSGARWGDYTSLNVDPVDDCTFWYVNEWFPVSGGNWTLRIGAFKFNECGTPDFYLGASPSSQTVCAGTDANYTINVGAIAGFTNQVTLAASGHPGGTTASFAPNPVTPPGSSEFTVGNTAAAAPGTYSIDVSGTAASSPGHSTAVELVVDVGNPAAATLTSPANGATNVPLLPTFTWTAAAGASSYLIEVDDDTGFATPIYSETVVLTTATPVSALPSSTQLYWRVAAINSCGSTLSSVFSFITEAAPGDCPFGTTTRPLYDYGFESGLAGWTSSGTGNTWAVTSTVAYVHSGTQAMHATDPAAVSDQRLESPSFVLPTGQDPVVLEFWNFQTLEDAAGGCFDGAIVEISTNGGTSWTQITSGLLTDPYDGIVSTSRSNPLGGRNAWCGDPQPYLNSVVDLTSHAGQTVKLRFRLGSDNTIGRTAGWNIDDVRIESCLPANTIFIGDFETGDTSQWSAAVP